MHTVLRTDIYLHSFIHTMLIFSFLFYCRVKCFSKKRKKKKRPDREGKNSPCRIFFLLSIFSTNPFPSHPHDRWGKEKKEILFIMLRYVCTIPRILCTQRDKYTAIKDVIYVCTIKHQDGRKRKEKKNSLFFSFWAGGEWVFSFFLSFLVRDDRVVKKGLREKERKKGRRWKKQKRAYVCMYVLVEYETILLLGGF